MNIVLVGHRGTGKTVTGAAVAELLGYEHVDVDAEIERRTETTCAKLVAEDEDGFRELEIATLAQIVRGERQVVSTGAGIQELPSGALIVWLQRDGWEETARTERQRLRPTRSWPEEVEWMCASREPRWLAAAHLHIHVPRCRPVERVAKDVATYVRWLEDGLSTFAQKTWVVASSASEFARAEHDAALFGLAGVEVRSDVFVEIPASDVTLLGSLRTEDPGWLARAAERCGALDIDVTLIDTLFGSGVLDTQPRPLLLSCHPAQVDPDDVTELVSAVRRIQSEAPAWAAGLIVKYAPQLSGVADIGVGRALVQPLRRAGLAVTYLPQGAPYAWVRPILLGQNASNYVSTRLRPDRAGIDSEGLTPWDFMDWLPHLASTPPQAWDVLLGDPVAQSQGDLWHRRTAIESGEHTGYVKVPTTEENFDITLKILGELGVRGASVTSPLKKLVTFIVPNDASFGLLLQGEARLNAFRDDIPRRDGNTLRLRNGQWEATDTDEVGMAASLDWFVEQGVGPATVALFGSGGVAPALLRALDASDWFVVFKTRARDGWPENTPPFVTLVVNASGSQTDSREGAPKSRAWLDLHYMNVAPAPEGTLHLGGDVFFDAQAIAQREFWNGA